MIAFLDKVELNQVKSELMEQVEKQTKELSNASSEIAKLEAALFNTKNQVERLEKKEDLRKTTETQLIEARKQIILQGELLRYNFHSYCFFNHQKLFSNTDIILTRKL